MPIAVLSVTSHLPSMDRFSVSAAPPGQYAAHPMTRAPLGHVFRIQRDSPWNRTSLRKPSNWDSIKGAPVQLCHSRIKACSHGLAPTTRLSCRIFGVALPRTPLPSLNTEERIPKSANELRSFYLMS